MTTTRFTMRVLATLTLWAGFGLPAFAQIPAPTVEKAFEVKPRQPGVPITTPEQAGKCRVEAIPNPQKPGSNMGYVVRDADGKPVRQFVSYDDKTFNIVAFYVNGVEAYREVYPPKTTEPNQFRWLGPNGGKWGLDKDKDGKVDEWVVISPEEVSQELLQAVLTKDAKRLEALLPSKESLESLGLPAPQVNQIRDRAAKAIQKLNDAADALKLSPEAKWVHLELGIPQTTPADAFGGREDLVVHKNGTILIQDGKDTKFLQIGELVLVGRAWKVVDGPGAGPGNVDIAANPSSTGGPVITEAIRGLVGELDKIDKDAPTQPTPESLATYYGRRVVVLEQIVQKLPPEHQAEWVKLLIDSLAAAAEGGKAENPHHARLKQLKDVLGKGAPQNPLVSYAAFRLLVAENAMGLKDATGTTIPAIQERWRIGLEEFIKAYPTSADAPEAVLRLAMAWEFTSNKDGEEKAKTWYDYLVKNYSQHHHAAKASGAKRRLEAEGKPLELSGTILTNGQNFTPSMVAGKPVIVYYWASWSSSLADDAKKLKDLATTYGPKGLEIVTVCLDDDHKLAADSIRAVGLPGTHLHMKGGLDSSPLAAGYGIMVVPHILVVGKDGKVTNKNGQLTTLEDEVKKLTQ